MIAALAGKQRGVITTEQLRALGYTPKRLGAMVQAGWLIRLHVGVYAVGHTRLTWEARLESARLACGTGAVVSHVSAVGLHALRGNRPALADVTSPRHLRHRPGIRVHQSRLHAADLTAVDRIPVTSVMRTLIDVAGLRVFSDDDLRAMLNRADQLQTFDLGALQRHANRPGASRLARLVVPLRFTATRSELEERFLRLVEQLELPPPLVNALYRGRERDVHWPLLDLIVELDGRDVHATAAAFEDDRHRDQDMLAEGTETIRFTGRDVFFDAARVRRILEAVVARRRAEKKISRPCR